ncbi:transcriptional regulator [Rhodococcus sp. SJ-3]|uniref:transcriptional regulator n=1 Tax=Rhodococcus sp. SJ-3 TaxID=3454628 RepID=UPI003F7B31E3
MSEYRPPRRVALIVLVVVAAAGCLALGYWQWTRFEEVGGNGQNLGYAFQWPAFAFFCIYAYRRFVKLEAEEAQTDDPDDARASKAEEPTEIPAELLPSRPKVAIDDAATDLEAKQVREYNEYLAQLSRGSDRSGQ